MTSTDRPVFNERYEVQQRIGRGGMADVFLARDLLLDRPVAIKVLFQEFATDPNFVERFRREAQSAANLNHPNIVGVYDWGRQGPTYFMAMEYVPGCSLEECDGWMPQWRTYVQGTVQAIGLDATNVYAVAELPGYHYVLTRTARAMAPRGQVAAPTPTELTRWDDASATAIYVDDRDTRSQYRPRPDFNWW